MEPVDVVVVGAGLAGLRAAQVLEGAGQSVRLFDAAPEVGGRLASRVLDGYVLDVGFQVVNAAYPELVATGVGVDLDHRRFESALRYVGPGGFDVVDPRVDLRAALAGLSASRQSRLDLARFAGLLAACAWRPASSIRRGGDRSSAEALERRGISAAFVADVVQPFLRGTLLDDELVTSWRYVQFVLRSFVRGCPGTYPTGVVALPRALASRLRATIVHLGEPVRAVRADRVATDVATYPCRHVLVATDPWRARELVGVAPVPSRAQTSWWFDAPAVHGGGRLRLDLERRFLTSALDVAAVASERAPRGRSLLVAAANGEHGGDADGAVRDDVARLYDLDRADVTLLERTVVARALAAAPAPLSLSRPSCWGDVFVAGDYCQTPSIQGALVSGRRAATALLQSHGVSPIPE